MARFNESMRGHVAGSMADRFTVNPTDPPPARSALERQGDGRRRLDAACVLRVDRIIPDPDQPRKDFDPEALARLAESLKTRGQLQPIRVRWDDAADRYVVVVGERRYRAALLAGLETMACVVAAGAPAPEDLLEDQLVENALREDLRPIEQARAYRALIAARGLSQRQLAERLQIGHASIARALALLDLPPEVQADVDAGRIAPNAAYEAGKLADEPARREVFDKLAAGELTRDDVAAEVRRRAGRASGPRGRGATKRKARKATSRTLRTPDGYRVTVEHRKGVDDDAIEAALAGALALVRAGRVNKGEAA